MHEKQLTTSQAFQFIPRKATVYQDVKALQVSLSKDWQVAAKVPRPALFEVTGQLFAYSTNLLQHVTVYEQYSQHPGGGAGVSWTHTYTHWTEHYDDGWSDYSYVLWDGVLWQWTTGGLQYTILYSLASEDNPRCTVKKTPQIHSQYSVSLFPAAHRFGILVFDHKSEPMLCFDTPNRNGMCSAFVALVRLSFPQTGSLSIKADSTVSNILQNEQSSRGSERERESWGLLEFLGSSDTRSGAGGQFSLLTAVPSSAPPLRWESSSDGPFLFKAWWPLHLPSTRLSITTSTYHCLTLIFTALHTPPTLQRRCTRL